MISAPLIFSHSSLFQSGWLAARIASACLFASQQFKFQPAALKEDQLI